jgi:hypothetical protein
MSGAQRFDERGIVSNECQWGEQGQTIAGRVRGP